MSFVQTPPTLRNTFTHDAFFCSYLRLALSEGVYSEAITRFEELGELASGELLRLQQEDRLNEPLWTPWDAWGRRVDHIEPTAVWKRAEEVAVGLGLIRIPYAQTYGAESRLVQMALAFLLIPATDMYACPLAMTDGAARTLSAFDEDLVLAQALGHLLADDSREFWTSGQWMTETTGGSDVGLTETEARQDESGWRLYGRKWFTSAAQSRIALTLARPQGNGPGGKGLALFYVEARDADGRLQNIRVDRLKDKLGTRKLPTAELTLDGTPATPVAGLRDGIRAIAPMLNVTRMWNAVSAASLMRRGLSLARDYASQRRAFGAKLEDKPLHRRTLSQLEAEAQGAFHLAFEVVRLQGRVEGGEVDGEEQALLRGLTPIAKLLTAKQAVAVLSEVIECFGGAGYVEDTGLPVLLRDAQVLPIWEGTTNVLALDLLRVLVDEEVVKALLMSVSKAEEEALASDSFYSTEALEAAREAKVVVEKSLTRLREGAGPEEREAVGRDVALSIGRSIELALLVRFALASEGTAGHSSAVAAATRFRWNGVDCHSRGSLAVDRAVLGL